MTKSPCAGPLRPALGVAYSRHRPDEPLTMSSCSLAWSFSTARDHLAEHSLSYRGPADVARANSSGDCLFSGGSQVAR